MKCPNCKSPVDKDAVFCEVCGARIDGGKRKSEPSRIPVVIVSSILFLSAVGGLAFWVVSDDYHGDGAAVAAGTENSAGAADTEEGVQETQPAEAGEDPQSDQASGAGQDETQPGDDGTGAQAPEDQQQQQETQPAYDPTEGGIHRYEYVVSDCTWSEAYQNCLNSGGYLVRINSKEEFDYIISEIDQQQLTNIQFRVGGRRDANSQDYYWVDASNQLYGEKINSDTYWCAGLWLQGEPSFSDGQTEENSLDIFYYGNEGRWVLNDVPDNLLSTAPEFSGKIGYICEYEN